MMQYDLSCWPLVLSASSGKPSLDDLRGYSAAWSAWLDRGERFATLRLLLDSDAYGHPTGGTHERKSWFTEYGERLKTQVLSMATVAPPDVVRKTNKIEANRLYGVPARSFVTIEDAIDWLMPHLLKEFDGLNAATLQQHALRFCSANTPASSNTAQGGAFQ